jgi:hypothetical protein
MSRVNNLVKVECEERMDCISPDTENAEWSFGPVHITPSFPRGMQPMIVDVEGFQTPDRFVIKELALYTPSSNARKCIVLAPPFSRKHMLKKTITTMDWVTKNLHGLEWDDVGDYDYPVAAHLLQLHGCTHNLFSKGLEKCKWIGELAMCPVYDLELIGCPCVDDLHHIELDHKCENHGTSDFSCALVKAFRFGKWYQHMLSLSVL